MQKIVPNLWFDKEAQAAAEFYCRIFPNSNITGNVLLRDTPGGDNDLATFNLNGHDFMALSGGPLFYPMKGAQKRTAYRLLPLEH